MWFSHSGKLGALLCPKAIEISSDPNCFIFSMIISALWCSNKCRKLKLIAIFVFGNDSNCCSLAENKHLPLIKHPSGHEESVRFLQPFSSSLYLLTVCNICHWEKKVQTKQEMWGKQSKEISSKEVLCHRWNAGFFFSFSPHSSVTEHRNKLQRSVVTKQNRAVPLGLWNNGSDPIYSTLSLGFILPLNAQMLWPFFGRNDCGHLLHIFPFWAIFSS